MPRNYDAIDLTWTLNGDLSVGNTGDLSDTTGDVLTSLRQEIRTRVRSSLEDWELHPSLGANLDEIIGEVNNKSTAEIGKKRIIASLTRDSFMAEGDIQIQYTPVDRHRLLYIMRISVAPTPANDNSQEFVEKFLFHMQDRGYHFF